MNDWVIHVYGGKRRPGKIVVAAANTKMCETRLLIAGNGAPQAAANMLREIMKKLFGINPTIEYH